MSTAEHVLLTAGGFVVVTVSLLALTVRIVELADRARRRRNGWGRKP